MFEVLVGLNIKFPREIYKIRLENLRRKIYGVEVHVLIVINLEFLKCLTQRCNKICSVSDY